MFSVKETPENEEPGEHNQPTARFTNLGATTLWTFRTDVVPTWIPLAATSLAGSLWLSGGRHRTLAIGWCILSASSPTLKAGRLTHVLPNLTARLPCRAHTRRRPHRLTSRPGQISGAVEDVADLHIKRTRDTYERGHRRVRAAVFDVHQVLWAEPGFFRRFLLAELLSRAKYPDALPQVLEDIDGFRIRTCFRPPLRAGLLRESGHEPEQAPPAD